MVRNTMQSRIFTATEADIDEIMRIENNAFKTGIRENRTTFLDRLTVCPECFMVLSSANQSIREREECERFPHRHDRLDGYLSAELWSRMPEPSFEAYRLGHLSAERHHKDGTILYVSSFAVDQGARGGTGRAFFTGSILRIRMEYPQITRIALAVNEHWQAARRIYDTEGFRCVAQIKGFFDAGLMASQECPCGEDALIMEKTL